MSDISQISIDGNIYNIKDAVARANIGVLQEKATTAEEDISTLFNAVGSPLVAATAAAMTDHDKIYVYTGSETGYTVGNWYYWDGSDWVTQPECIYNSTAFNADATLSVSGAAAEAKATGDKVKYVQNYVDQEYGMLREKTANLIDVPVGHYYYNNGAIVAASSSFIGMSDYIPCEEETDYAFLCYGSGGTSRFFVQWLDESKTVIGSEDQQLAEYSTAPGAPLIPLNKTSPEGAQYIYFCVYRSGMADTAKIQIRKGTSPISPASEVFPYVAPFTAKDDVARTQIGELEVKTALMNYGQVTNEWLTEQGFTNLIQLPVGYTYAVNQDVTIDGKPSAFQDSSFTFIAIKCMPSYINYNVYFAIGRDRAYHAIGYGGDTTPAWVISMNPEIPSIVDFTLPMRWNLLTSKLKIVLLGDSIVQGFGSSDYSPTGDEIATIGGTVFRRNVGVKSWGAQFKAKLEAEYNRGANMGIQVINNGLPKKGISDITDNLDLLVPDNTNVAIVCTGVNNRTWGGTDIKTAYVELFEALKAKDITVLALSAVDVNGATYTSSMGQINTVLELACEQCEVPYYNLYGEFNAVANANTKSEYYYDEKHPNDKGYALMFGLICKLLNF